MTAKMTHLEGGRAALGSLLACPQNRTKRWILGDVLVPSDLLRKTPGTEAPPSPSARGVGGNSAHLFLPCRSRLSVSLSPSPPWPAGNHTLPIPSSRVLCMACPPIKCPVGAFVLPGPRTFLSCFTFHFRIPCRADPSPERPSPPRAYRSVARISYTSQATWGRKRMTQGPTPGKLGGPCSPALQSSGGAAASGTGQSA